MQVVLMVHVSKPQSMKLQCRKLLRIRAEAEMFSSSIADRPLCLTIYQPEDIMLS
jgi:hypothetical protein